MSECDNDELCNGYSIDTSNNHCFLSNCDVFIDVPECSTCYFASKKTPLSAPSCSPTTDVQTTTTTPQSTIMIQTTTLTESTTIPTTTTNMPSTTELKPSTVLTTDGTTQNIIVNSTLCFCVCKNTNQTVEESIKIRRKKLTLNKTQLSSFIRKLSSAQDDRRMSGIIGVIAIVTLVLFGLFLCVADICSGVSK